MKKFITGLFLALMLLTPLAPVSASIKVPERTSTKTWVEDFANVLSPQTEQYIQTYSQYLADDHSACIMVVTMDYVTGEIDDYCLSMFNQWRIGDSNLNNGVLLLLSIGDDDYYMMIGRGLEDDFPISDIQNLLDRYLEPDFAVRDYDSGVRKVFEKTYDYMENNIYYQGNTEPNNNTYSAINGLYVLIGMIICFIIIISVLRSIRRVRRYYEPAYYYTRPRPVTYYSPYSYRPYTTHYYTSSPSSSYHSSSGSGSSHSSSSHSSSSHSSHTGSGTSFGGSSRGAGAGRRH